METTVKKDDKRKKNITPDNLAALLMIKKQVRIDDKNRKKDKPSIIIDERSSIFDNVKMCNMVDAFILKTPAFRLIEYFKSIIQEVPTYICLIC